MLELCVQSQFKKDLKLAKKRGQDIDKLTQVVNKLIAEEPLDAQYRDHILRGNYRDCCECHLEPDWLLIYFIDKEKGLLHLFRTGTHTDLFD